MTVARALSVGASPIEVLMLSSVYCVSFISTHALLVEPPVQYWRIWAEVIFYLAATVGGGLFFSWLTRSIVKLRAHEHRQNNVLTALVLQSDQHADDLGAIRRVLGIPRD